MCGSVFLTTVSYLPANTKKNNNNKKNTFVLKTKNQSGSKEESTATPFQEGWRMSPIVPAIYSSLQTLTVIQYQT